MKYRLRLVGSSFAKIAKELEVSASTVAAVSAGRGRSRRIEAAIATKLDTQPERLWPERYCCPQCGARISDISHGGFAWRYRGDGEGEW